MKRLLMLAFVMASLGFVVSTAPSAAAKAGMESECDFYAPLLPLGQYYTGWVSWDYDESDCFYDCNVPPPPGGFCDDDDQYMGQYHDWENNTHICICCEVCEERD